MKIHLIAGARPNFMKIAPLWHSMKECDALRPVIVHTGQHYSSSMSDSIFADLRLPAPDFYLGVGGGSHGEQTGRIMIAYDKICQDDNPDLVLVVGDVNSTLAAAFVGKKLGKPIIHLEAGLRSFDMRMPEEVNRVAVDAISDLLLTPSSDADENLMRAGIDRERIVRVGNIMIDSFEMLRERIEKTNTFQKVGLASKEYAVLTLHRPSNVDDPVVLERVVDAILKLSTLLPICFPVHPRTSIALKKIGATLQLKDAGVRLIDPLGYVEFMSLISSARYVITDSGGIQEETTYIGVPCLTLRESTERPITVSQGTNKLVSLDNVFMAASDIAKKENQTKKSDIDLWDGNAASRVVSAILNNYVS
ncbi:MAG: UDP-N-acetylglucosamine 2-epimerase (non-hydrolyzing) [Pseudomonadota bacterium]|nr:UDP-N-acetylglucosamine 2-epimerase (non-hydrolyzing) [Pseudomonadota bacterium]